jgi:hypothetical protein
MRSPIGALLGSLLVLTVVVSRADAGIASSVTLTWPDTLATHEEFTGSIVIVNQSTSSNASENITLTTLFVTPACAARTSPVCLPPNLDPFIFGLHNPVGAADTPSCAGIQFAIINRDDTTGEVEMTPTRPITLGPANGSEAGRTCRINVPLSVTQLPRNPAGGTFGTTNTLARVTLRGVSTGLNGGGSGSTHVTVVKATPEMSTTTDPSKLAVLPGQSVTDFASVEFDATGTVTFFLCQPNEVTPGRGCVSGGTQIGSCLETFVDRYLDEMVGPSSVVIIVSDGLDRGDTAPLAGAMRAIHSRARKVVWLNPLLGDPRYEPTARGMAAALPYVDVFAPAHNLESLEKLVPRLSAA